MDISFTPWTSVSPNKTASSMADWEDQFEDSLSITNIQPSDLGTGIYPYINVQDPAYGAVADGSTDDTAAIQAAIDAAEAGNIRIVYFPPHADGDYYKITSAITITKPLILMGGENTSDGVSQLGSLVGTCRIVYAGSSGATMFKWQSATGGNFLVGGGAKNIRFSGCVSGAALADKALHAVDVAGFVFDNVSIERCITAGIHLESELKTTAYNVIDRYRYTYGNSAVDGEDSDALLIGQDSDSMDPEALTHTHIGMMNVAVRNGYGLRVRGNVDSLSCEHIHCSTAGTGGVIGLIDNTGTGKSPRRHHFNVVAGRPIVVGSACKAHTVGHYNYDGTTAILADMFTVASGGEIRATVADNTSSFNVHYGKRIPTVASASPLVLPDTVDNFCDVTGTTSFTNITAVPALAGKTVTLRFAGVLTMTDGGNLTLDGGYTTAATDTITLFHDGTDWIEVSRSQNST